MPAPAIIDPRTLRPIRRYLLRDEFNGAALADPRWTDTDPEGKMSLSGGNLSFSGGDAAPSWGSPARISVRSFRRRAGLTFETEATPAAANKYFQLGWNDGSALDGVEEAAIYFHASGYVAFTNAASVRLPLDYSGGTSYRAKLVLKAAGSLLYISSDGGVTWKLLWEEPSSNTASLKAFVNSYSAAFTSSFCYAYQGRLKPPVVSDTFTRADSALTLGSAETGQAYMVNAGTWGISSNKAYSVTDTNDDRVLLETGVADGIVEVTVNGTLNSGVVIRVPDLIFRAASATNHLLLDLVNGAIALYKRNGAAYVLLASAATPTNDNTDYTLRAVCNGNLIDVYVDDVLKISYTLAGGDTAYAAYTQVGMRLQKAGAPATAARWDNLSVQV